MPKSQIYQVQQTQAHSSSFLSIHPSSSHLDNPIQHRSNRQHGQYPRQHERHHHHCSRGDQDRIDNGPDGEGHDKVHVWDIAPHAVEDAAHGGTVVEGEGGAEEGGEEALEEAARRTDATRRHGEGRQHV